MDLNNNTQTCLQTTHKPCTTSNQMLPTSPSTLTLAVELYSNETVASVLMKRW